MLTYFGRTATWGSTRCIAALGLRIGVGILAVERLCRAVCLMLSHSPPSTIVDVGRRHLPRDALWYCVAVERPDLQATQRSTRRIAGLRSGRSLQQLFNSHSDVWTPWQGLAQDKDRPSRGSAVRHVPVSLGRGLVRETCSGSTGGGGPTAAVATNAMRRHSAGCPISGNIFALCIDPFLRRLMVRSLVDLIRLMDAGDSAVVFANLWADLTAVVADFARWVAATQIFNLSVVVLRRQWRWTTGFGIRLHSLGTLGVRSAWLLAAGHGLGSGPR